MPWNNAPAGYYHDLRAWYKEHGICTECGQKDAAPGRVRCLECLSKAAERNYQYRQRMTPQEVDHYKQVKKAGDQARRDRRREAGLCVACGKSAWSGQYCYEHTLYHRRREREKRQAQRVYKQPGTCTWCDLPAVDGKKLCAEHYEQQRASMLRARECRTVDVFREMERASWKARNALISHENAPKSAESMLSV